MYKINSVNFNKDTTKIKYSCGGEQMSLSSEELPDPDFTDAIASLTTILRRNLQLDIKRPEECAGHLCMALHPIAGRVWATSLEVRTKETDYDTKVTYKISGKLTIPAPAKNVSIEGLPMEFDNTWFEDTDRKGELLHKPCDYPTYLTAEDMEAIERVLQEAAAFIDGKRDQKVLPYKQPTQEEKDLFDAANITKDCDQQEEEPSMIDIPEEADLDTF